MTLEKLYQSYKTAFGSSPVIAVQRFFVERLIGANQILFLFLANFCGVGVENSHCILLLFTLRLAREHNQCVISADSFKDHPQNILDKKTNALILEWLKKGDIEKGFPDLGITLNLKCNALLAGEELGEIIYEEGKETPTVPRLPDHQLLTKWGLRW